MGDPVLHLVAGPNGAGKTTFHDRVLAPATSLPFVNADHLAARHWPGDEAAQLDQPMDDSGNQLDTGTPPIDLGKLKVDENGNVLGADPADPNTVATSDLPPLTRSTSSGRKPHEASSRRLPSGSARRPRRSR